MTLLEREECIFSVKRQVTEAWGQFLVRFPWDWFVTLTFRDPVVSFRAHRLFDKFVRDLEKAAGLPVFWFRVDEIGPHGGRFHLHALIGNVAHLRRMTWVDKWNLIAGYARILPFNAKQGAAYYTAKYVAKQSSEWGMSENMDGFRMYQPVLALGGTLKPKPGDPTAVVPRSERSRRKPSRQLPLATGQSSPLRGKDFAVQEIYRQEVTRGRGRFKTFFPSSTEDQ